MRWENVCQIEDETWQRPWINKKFSPFIVPDEFQVLREFFMFIAFSPFFSPLLVSSNMHNTSCVNQFYMLKMRYWIYHNSSLFFLVLRGPSCRVDTRDTKAMNGKKMWQAREIWKSWKFLGEQSNRKYQIISKKNYRDFLFEQFF